MVVPLKIEIHQKKIPACERAGIPVVVVGNGPAGMRVVRELLRRKPATSVVVYGDERHPSYNRVRLSQLLAGRASWGELPEADEFPAGAKVEQRLGVRVLALHPGLHEVVDSEGRHQPYAQLILATGSCHMSLPFQASHWRACSPSAI